MYSTHSSDGRGAVRPENTISLINSERFAGSASTFVVAFDIDI